MTNAAPTTAATATPAHLAILARFEIDAESVIEIGADFHPATAAAMERRGLIEIRTRVQSGIHARHETYRVAMLTRAGHNALFASGARLYEAIFSGKPADGERVNYGTALFVADSRSEALVKAQASRPGARIHNVERIDWTTP